MAKIQNIVGDLSETGIAKLFNSFKYWAFVIPKSPRGQPFDIIACRQNNIYFVDAKHLESQKASFPFDRIEANQITSMKIAREFASVKNLGFVINWERDERFYFLSYDKFLELKGQTSVKIESLPVLEEVIK